MKLRNKKTGEIVFATMKASYGGGELQIRYYPLDNAEDTQFKEYRSISELNEEWEDYKEPKEDGLDNIITLVEAYSNEYSERYPKEIVEKLKAWKRLENKGFRFKGCRYWDIEDAKVIEYELGSPMMDKQVDKDLELLFSEGEK